MKTKVFYCGEYHPKKRVVAQYIDDWGGLYCLQHKNKATTPVLRLAEAGTFQRLLAQTVPSNIPRALRDEYLKGKAMRIETLEKEIKHLQENAKRN